MRYDKDGDLLSMGMREFVTRARRGISEALPFEEDEPEMRDGTPKAAFLEGYAPVPGEYRFSLGGHGAVVHTVIDKVGEGGLFFAVPCDATPSHPGRELVAEARGEAYIAALSYLAVHAAPSLSLTFLYFRPATGETHETVETVTKKKLDTFFEKCRIALETYAVPEIERVTVRLSSFAALRFPYRKPREGQEEFIHAVYRTVKRGGRLFAEAPTGTGKTVSALYPALRAMAAGGCDKVFYFTPKRTTAKAAEDCLCDLSHAGAVLTAVTLTAKEHICERHTVCRTGRAACPLAKVNKLADAALALYKEGLVVVGMAELRRVGEAFGVCPYELALTYAELADVVILDFNYLFDPFVYLKRFFTDGGNYAFLIDEAHNLPERAAAMYSAEISEEEIAGASLPLGEHAALRHATKEAAEAFRATLFPILASELREDKDGEKVGATHTRELPARIYSLFDALASATEKEIFITLSSKEEGKEEKLAALRSYYAAIRRFHKILSYFDDRYEAFYFYDGGRLTLKLFCVDTGRVISDRLDLGRSAVFFSGTLSPLPYFRAMLGADGSDETLTLPSPFDRGQLSVAIMDKIGTRLSERERTLPAVLRVIAATVSAKRGNYIVFTPSFAYNAMLAAAFRAKYPKIRVLEQTRGATEEDTDAFFKAFRDPDPSYLVAFCVTGGVYSEGIDLAGDSLIGTVIVGTGMPAVSFERESMCAYFDEKYEAGKAYAYVYPGMNRVLQAGGRVIRREEDRGVIVLIDDRFSDPLYKKSIPALWRGLKFVGDAKGLKMLLDKFWSENKNN
ncbi:MAG TPA: hypothetical protein DDY70_06800 [Clostridiales bacterium]|nr:hypothetical protein [Clostridiales bacterium]